MDADEDDDDDDDDDVDEDEDEDEDEDHPPTSPPRHQNCHHPNHVAVTASRAPLGHQHR